MRKIGGDAVARPEELDADTVIGQYLEGYEVGLIAMYHSATAAAIYAILERNSIPLRSRKSLSKEPDPALDGMVDEYFASSQPIAWVTAKWGVSPGRLYRELALRGLEVRQRKRSGMTVNGRLAGGR